jgi:macrolide-specific efflux system membrane fusion protein
MVCLIVILFLFPTGCGVFPSEEEALVPPLAVPEEIIYKTVEAKTGYIEKSIKGTATFVSFDERNIFFENNSGRLKELYAKIGDNVKKGDLIAELLTDNIEREIANQEIVVDSKQKDLNYTKSIADIEINMSEDQVKELEKKYNTMLNIPEAYSLNEIESTKKEIESHKSIFEKLKLSWSNQLELKKDDLESAKLVLEGLRKDVQNCRLISPVDGKITYTASLKEGEFADAYITIATIAKPGDLQLKYKGLNANKFELSMKVDIQTNSGKKCTGEVVLTESSVPVEEMEKYDDTVLIKPDEILEGIERGESADIKLVLKSADNALIIPKSAVKKYMGRDIVYVLEGNLRAERYVEIGIESINEVQVLEGIKVGEMVVIE